MMIATALLLMSVYAHAQTACQSEHHFACEGEAIYGYFGVPAISGSWMILGESNRDNPSFPAFFNQGAVHFYEKRNGQWEFHSRHFHDTPVDGPDEDTFGDGEFMGASVAMDGRWAIAGSYGYSNKAGRLVAFERTYSGGVYSWVQDADLVFQNPQAGEYLGGGAEFRKAVAVSGNWAAAGAPLWEDTINSRIGSGRVAVWEWDNGWPEDEQSQILRADNFSGVATEQNAYFGAAIAMDGDWLVIGEPDRTINQTIGAGRVYVYKRQSGTWNPHTMLISPDIEVGGAFGYSVDIKDDVIVVGARFESVASNGTPGRVHLFRYLDSQWSAFGGLLSAPDDNPTFSDLFGNDVSLSGTLLLAGAPARKHGSNAYGTGILFQYDSNGNWNHTLTMYPGIAASGHTPSSFGDTVAISGTDAAVYTDRYNIDANTPNVGTSSVYKSLPTCTNNEPVCEE